MYVGLEESLIVIRYFSWYLFLPLSKIAQICDCPLHIINLFLLLTYLTFDIFFSVRGWCCLSINMSYAWYPGGTEKNNNKGFLITDSWQQGNHTGPLHSATMWDIHLCEELCKRYVRWYGNVWWTFTWHHLRQVMIGYRFQNNSRWSGTSRNVLVPLMANISWKPLIIVDHCISTIRTYSQ